MKHLAMIMLLMISISAFAGPEAKNFDPLTPEEKSLFRFQLEKRFYADETAWKTEMEKTLATVTKLESFKGKVLQSPPDLLSVMDARVELSNLQDKLDAYAYFKKAINTDDRKVFEAQEKLDSDISSRMSFLKIELKPLTMEKLEQFVSLEPKLKRYHYYLEDIARMGPHLLSQDKEEILGNLGPSLQSWQGDLFQKLFDRNVFPTMKVGEKEFNIHIDFTSLMQNPDNAVREKAFKDYYEFFKKTSDLLGFSLRQLMKTANQISKMRGFDSYYDQSLFERYLTRVQIDSLYAQIEKALPLYHAYQKYRIEGLKKDLGKAEVAVWDMEMPPKESKTLRLTATEGTKVLNGALKVLGASYSYEMGALLDPKNGRLDIVGGPKREQGAFCIGFFGYFMDNFQGFVGDVSTMAHEGGHAIFSQFVKNGHGSLLFEGGPSYMTESFAMFNEWLMRDYLMTNEKDPEIAAGIRWDAVNEMMYLWELARRAKFEMVSYDRVAKDEITDEKGFNKACLDVGNQYDLLFAKHPELEFHWIRKHHYWTNPTYYLNYVIAHMLALKYLEMFKADPQGFPPKYIAMLSAGFDRPASKLLKDFLGIELENPSLLNGVFEMIQKKFDEIQTPKTK